MKPVILNVMDEGPAYSQLGNRTRPPVSWDVPSGAWVGIWDYDWADVIGRNLLAITNDFDYEVLQPDLRTDRIYETRFESGVSHKLFPANQRTRWHGFRRSTSTESPALLSYVNQQVDTRRAVVHLQDITHPAVLDMVEALHPCRVISHNLGAFSFPLQTFWAPQKNVLAKIQLLRDHFRIRRVSSRVAKYLHCGGPEKQLRRYFSEPRETLVVVGLDGLFWRPRGTRAATRGYLGAGPSTCVLLCASPLRPSKQVDRFIRAMKAVRARRPWMAVIAGTGSDSCVDRLRELCGDLLRDGAIRFTGFVPDEELRDLYEAADIFVNPSRNEGGPMAAVKALAMGLPVFTTDSGLVASWVKGRGCGRVVPPRAFAKWPAVIGELLDSQVIPLPNKADVLDLFEWRNVSLAYAKVYREVLNGGIPFGWN